MTSRYIISQRVILETADGSKLIELELSDEAREGLTVGGGDSTSYRHHVQEGDRVRLPDGREGAVYMVEIKDGHFKVASIRPDKPKRRLFGLLPAIPVRLADDEIDQLVLLPSEEEIRRIMDDPVELGLEP